MGCSNPHPHGQVWSLSVIPSLPATELASLKKYSESTPPSDAPKGPLGRPCLLCDYIHFEVSVAHGEGRVVVQNDHWVALVPWWAIWPFEIMRKQDTPYKLGTTAHLVFSPPLQTSCAFHRSPFPGREVCVCANSVLGHYPLRQLVLVLVCIFDGHPPTAYSSCIRRYCRRPGRRGPCSSPLTFRAPAS